MGRLSKAIEKARKSRFANRAEAADALGVHFRSQANYELGERVPSVGYLAELANETGQPFIRFIQCLLIDESELSEYAKHKALGELSVSGITPEPQKPVKVILDIGDPHSVGELIVNGTEYTKK